MLPHRVCVCVSVYMCEGRTRACSCGPTSVLGFAETALYGVDGVGGTRSANVLDCVGAQSTLLHNYHRKTKAR